MENTGLCQQSRLRIGGAHQQNIIPIKTGVAAWSASQDLETADLFPLENLEGLGGPYWDYRQFSTRCQTAVTTFQTRPLAVGIAGRSVLHPQIVMIQGLGR